MPKLAAPKGRQRATQRRAEDTRKAILITAATLFSSYGFDGVSIRTIETEAEVKRGLVAYHFGTKGELWKAAMAQLFGQMPAASGELQNSLQDLPRNALLRARITRFVQFSAQYPEVGRMIMLEGRTKTWRLDHLLEQYIRPRVALMEALMEGDIDAHRLYVLLGASTLVFDQRAECRELFGIDSTSEEFVRQHAKFVCDVLLGEAGSIFESALKTAHKKVPLPAI